MVASNPLVVLLRKSRGECSLDFRRRTTRECSRSGPPAGITPLSGNARISEAPVIASPPLHTLDCTILPSDGHFYVKVWRFWDFGVKTLRPTLRGVQNRSGAGWNLWLVVQGPNFYCFYGFPYLNYSGQVSPSLAEVERRMAWKLELHDCNLVNY